MATRLDSRSKYNIILFGLSFCYIFVIGWFTQGRDLIEVYFAFLSLIILFSVFTIRSTGAVWFYVPIALVILTWFGELLHFDMLSWISGYLAILFFLFVIVLLVIRVARSHQVGLREFLESINVYLLLGIAGSILFNQVAQRDPGAFNYPADSVPGRLDFIYYSFVTMTTLGYGDITPAEPGARVLSMFFSVTGQLYLTMIIALLVGKYLSQKE